MLVSSQAGYLPIGTITKIGDYELNKASDIFIDKEDILYIADTTNARGNSMHITRRVDFRCRRRKS